MATKDLPRFLVVCTPNLPKKVLFVYPSPDFKKALPINYARPVRVFVKRRLKEERYLHSYYVSTLSLPSKGLFMAYYNQRGAAEIEQFRNEKSGLNLTARRKRRFQAQIRNRLPLRYRIELRRGCAKIRLQSEIIFNLYTLS